MDLQEFIAETNGIKLHRTRVLTAFSHLPEGPLMDALYNLTRPAAQSKPKLSALHSRRADKTSEQTPEKTPPTPTIVRKGMVNYRREFLGLNDAPK
jgi:hypothetical protein